MQELAAQGVLVAPGEFYGPAGDRHVRVALTATDERIGGRGRPADPDVTQEASRARGPAARPVRPVVVLLGLLALAVNLRAALAAYPPLLETVRVDLGISAGAAGLVQAGAMLMMAVGSFAGSAFGERIGRERGLGASVALVALGSRCAASRRCSR